MGLGRNGERVANTPMRTLPPRRGGRTVGDQPSRSARENALHRNALSYALVLPEAPTSPEECNMAAFGALRYLVSPEMTFAAMETLWHGERYALLAHPAMRFERDWEKKLLRALNDLCADWSEDAPGILQKCTASYHDDGAGRHVNILYGDYFFVEALCKLRGTDAKLWWAKE